MLVGFVKLGPPTLKISDGVAKDKTLLRLNEILKFVFHWKPFVFTFTELIENSNPLFSIEPTFLRIVP